MTEISLPKRFAAFKWWSIPVLIVVFAVLVHAFFMTEFSELTLDDIMEIPGNLFRILSEMFPPSLAPVEKIGVAIVQTFQMAMVGVFLGIIISLPLGFFSARNITPTPVLYYFARAVISICRTVPDMVWALLFVIFIGLGPLAGCLTLVVDTIGFAGRFFAEAIEEVDPRPKEALVSLGASPKGYLFSYILPEVLPSFITTSLFSFERAVQSSVVLGLIGAGGIGMLLEEPMTWHNYAEASTVILGIFIMLAGVEQMGARFRKGIITEGGDS